MSRLVNILSGISTNYISKRERIRFGFIPTPIIYNNKKVKKSLNNKKKNKKKRYGPIYKHKYCNLYGLCSL